MEKICSAHDKVIIAVCLFEDCSKPHLCLSCVREHPSNHDCLIKEVSKIKDNEDWVIPYEQKREELVAKQKEIYTRKRQMYSDYRDRLKNMMSDVSNSLQKQKENVFLSELKELIEVMETDKNKTNKDLFSDFEKEFKTLKSINFREGDDFEKVEKIKAFNEIRARSAGQLIDKAEKALKSWELDQEKIDLYKNELIEFIEKIHLENFFTLSPAQSLKITDAFVALQKEKEEMTKEIDNLKSQIDSKTNELNDQKNQFEGSKNFLESRIQELEAKIAQLEINNEAAKTVQAPEGNGPADAVVQANA